MELRRSPRFELDQPVTVTNLEDKTAMPARLANFSTNGVRLLIGVAVPSGALLKVEWGTTLLLGEVIYCRPEENGFSVGMELEHALYDTTALANQMGARTTQLKVPE